MTTTFFNEHSISSYDYYDSQFESFNKIATERGLQGLSVTPPSSKRAQTESATAISALGAADGATSPPTSSTSAGTATGGQLTIQAGPGVPNWSGGQEVVLSWNGAVPKDHTIRLWYLPYWAGCLMAFLKGIFLIMLIQAVWSGAPSQLRELLRRVCKVGVGMCVLTLVPLSAAVAQDSYPAPELLSELAKRIQDVRALERPCNSNCVSTESADFSRSGDSLIVRAVVHSLGKNVWALPSAAGRTLLSAATLDGKPVEAARHEAGETWILVPDGIHTIEARGVLPPADVISVGFNQPVGHVVVDIPGYQSIIQDESENPVIRLVRDSSLQGGITH